jgi:hypothetical protein
MVELTDRPLKRGIALMQSYVNLTETGIEIKVRGSRKQGLRILWGDVIIHADLPENRPAKIATPIEYLAWVIGKRRPQKKHAMQPDLSEIGRHA